MGRTGDRGLHRRMSNHRPEEGSANLLPGDRRSPCDCGPHSPVPCPRSLTPQGRARRMGDGECAPCGAGEEDQDDAPPVKGTKQGPNPDSPVPRPRQLCRQSMRSPFALGRYRGTVPRSALLAACRFIRKFAHRSPVILHSPFLQSRSYAVAVWTVAPSPHPYACTCGSLSPITLHSPRRLVRVISALRTGGARYAPLCMRA